MSNISRLTGINAQIAGIFANGEQLKKYYRFVALNSHINLRDACHILLARPDATICYPYEEWNELGRQVKRGKKSIAYYDYDGYKQYVFDISDTRGENSLNYAILPIDHLITGLTELNDAEVQGVDNYSKILNGVKNYLLGQGVLSGEENRDEFITQGVAYSLYVKSGASGSDINFNGLPFTYQENAELVKEIYIQTEMLAQEIEAAYKSKQEEVNAIDDTEEETVSDEPIISFEQTKTIIENNSTIEEQLKEGKPIAYETLYKRYEEAQKIKPNAIVLIKNSYWFGDTYEIFGENVKKLAAEKEFTYIHIDVGLSEKVPMCSVPKVYLEEFIDEQIERHSILLVEDGKEPKYIQSKAETLAQNTEAEEKLQTGQNLEKQNVLAEPNHPAYPMYKRYMEFQEEKPYAVVLYRYGDFYEAFDESAKLLSSELDLTLTGRDVGLKERVPMCGIPYHALDKYLNKILKNHSVYLVDSEEESNYILSHTEALEQSADAEEKPIKPILTEVIDDEYSPFETEQVDDDEDWRKELAEELGEIADEQSDEELIDELDDGADEETDEFDEIENTDTDEERESPKKAKIKSNEKGIQDRKRKASAQINLFETAEESREDKFANDCLREEHSNNKVAFYDAYRKNLTISEFAELLRKTYGECGSYSGNKGITNNRKGMHIEWKDKEHPENNIAVHFKWNELAVRIAELIEADNYLTVAEHQEYERIVRFRKERESAKTDDELCKVISNQIVEYGTQHAYCESFREYPHFLEDYVSFYFDHKNEINARLLKHKEVFSVQNSDNNIWREINVSFKIKYCPRWQERLRRALAREHRVQDFANKFIESCAENYKENGGEFIEWTVTPQDIGETDYLFIKDNRDEFVEYIERKKGVMSAEFSMQKITLKFDRDYVIGIANGSLMLPSLQSQCVRNFADRIIESGTKNTTDGNWVTLYEDFKDDEPLVRELAQEISIELESHQEVMDVVLAQDGFDSLFYGDFCPNFKHSANSEKSVETSEFNRFKELTNEAKAYFESYQLISGREPENSPWEEVESCRTIANGIYEVSTARHGGLMISADLVPFVLSAEAQKIGFRYVNYLCFEEDCDAAIPLRELYDKGILTQRHNYFTHYHVTSSRPEAINGCVKFTEATENEKSEYFKWWNNAIDETIAHWNGEYWQAHEQSKLISNSEINITFNPEFDPNYGNEVVYEEDESTRLLVGDKFTYKDKEVTVKELSGLNPDEVVIEYEQRTGYLAYTVTQNIERDELLKYGARLKTDTRNTDLASLLNQNELGGAKKRFVNNVAAINLVNRLDFEKRNPTDAEKKILAQFVGWGGLSQAFDENNEDWRKEYTELKTLLSQADYEQARSSTLNAYYTAQDVINGIYSALNRFGVKGNNRILEPSMGTGNFFGFMPKEIADGAKLYGVELDNLTGRIAAKLYPQANVQIKGFEDTNFPNDKFDVVVGNVPFGGYGVADSDYNKYNFKVHDYFLAKSIDKVKPNGIVAIVTSKGTMDKLNKSARKYVAERAELLGAIRLPNTAFKQTAGTEAVADILFFKKREYQIAADETNTEWLGVYKTDEGYVINNYFANHPEMILGTLAEETGLYGGMDTTVKPDGRELSVAISEAVSHLPQDIYINPEKSPEEELSTIEDYNIKPFCYKTANGKLYMRVGDVMQEQPIPKFPKDAYKRIEGMIELREELHSVLDMQVSGCSDEVLQREQSKLNRQYDLFVKRYGNINSQTNTRLFREDGDSALLFACEDVDEETKAITKADIFSKRTIRPYAVPTNTDDCFEALQISKNERGRVDISYIEELTGKSYDDVLFELGDCIFRDPDMVQIEDKYSGFVTSEEYLSGFVKDKLYKAKQFAADYPEYQKNVMALEQVQPTPLTASEISVRLGQTWIDKKIFEQFYRELVRVPANMESDIEIYYNPHDSSWRLDQSVNVRFYTQMRQKQVYGTARAPAYRLFIDSMNLRPTTIYDTVDDGHGNERRVLNQNETIAAREKQNKIKEEFANWIFANPERREQLEDTYNRLFNRIKLPSYDGSYLKFPEMNPAIELKPHQKNAIHRVITSGDSTLLHHVVGSGKTYTIVASIMKMRQLGLCQKAMVAVPNHLVQQWASEWRKLYPNAKILVANKEDLGKDNRRRFISKVAMGDWDGIIIAQSSFAKIPISKERQIKKLNEEIASVEQTIFNQWSEKGMPRGAVKNLERIKKVKKAQLKKLMDDKDKDSVLNFESLGVDYLYIDEAHYYKNLFLFSKMSNVAGISNAASQRASDLKLKCEYLQEKHGSNRGVVFATGTPISNSMTEMYTMQTYLQPSVLKETNMTFFDGWAADFGETITSMELAPSGQGYRARTRFAKFTNLPELLKMYRSFADVQTADMVKLDVPEAERKVINLKPSDTVINLAEEIADRAENIYGGGVDTHIDNMLKVTSDGKKLALDPRCYEPMSTDEQGSKLNEAVQRIHEIWEDTSDKKGTQIVFCDLSTPKRKFEEYEYGTHFDAYNELKYKLVQMGIPQEEIAFIHDANTDERKQALFDSVNSGTVRVLIGSTEKCGAGTNVQKRLVALHHLDTPYRPSDMAQREGRIIRQGNTNEKVQIYTYVTERTFDSYSYQILENKQRFISQIDKGDLTVREAEDIDETTLSYAEIKAITAANPKIKRKMEVDTEIARLRVLEGQYRKNLYDLQDKIRKNYPEDIRKQELLIERVTLDLMHYQSSKMSDPEVFEISVNGKVYTDKKEGGKALVEALLASKPETVVAEYCGFKISMNPLNSLLGEREITVSANGQYTVGMGDSASGNIIRLDNFFNDLPARKERLEKRLQQIKEDLAVAQEQVKKPFEQAEQLSELLSEQTQLNTELNLDKREEAIIEDDKDSDDGNYRMLPTEKDIREAKIIDEEDKTTAIKMPVLPDYTITQENMNEYGYKSDDMLPLRRSAALKLWGMGLMVCKLGNDDDHVEIDDYSDFNDDDAIYGIEKAVWNKYLSHEKSLPYFAARLVIAESARVVMSSELNSIDETYTIDFCNSNIAEISDLKKYLADKPKLDSKELKPYAYQFLDEFSNRIWNDALKYYGWIQSDVPKSITEHITDEEIKKDLKKNIAVFNEQKELMNVLGGMSKQEIDDLRLPALSNELIVIAKHPDLSLNENGKQFISGVMVFQDEVNGNYYVVNDTAVRTISGKELEIGDETDVETVLAYSGIQNGNPLREFHNEREAKAYYHEKVNVIRSVAANSTDYRQAVKNSALLEYDEFKKSMLNASQSEVFSNNYKIHCFNEFGAVIDDDDEYFTDDDYKALYRERGHILESLYNDFIDSEGYSLENYDGTIGYIKNYCKYKHADIYNNKPIYLQTFRYADEHNEVQEYRRSHNISEDCKNDLTQAIRENFDGMRLNSDFENGIIKKYGIERVAYIVATTINEHEWDGRYSRENKDWAKTILMSENEDERSQCCLNVHPAVLDAFANRVRKKIKEEEQVLNNEENFEDVEKLIKFAESEDFKKSKSYYAFMYDRGPKGTGQYQVYMLDEGDSEIYPIFSDVILTEEDLKRKWQELSKSGVYAPVELIKCEPHELLKMSNQNMSRESKKMERDKYLNITPMGYKVLEITKDKNERNIAIIQREQHGDYIVAAGYNTSDGKWAQGEYCATLEGAKEYKYEKYDKFVVKETEKGKRNWLFAHVAKEALVAKHPISSFFRLPTYSDYAGYGYSIYNNRVKEGRQIADMPSDSRELCYDIRLAEDEEVILKHSSKDDIKLSAREFMELVSGTLSKDYEPKPRVDVNIPKEAKRNVYDNSTMFVLPNSVAEDKFSYFIPNRYITNGTDENEGRIILSIPEDFEIKAQSKGEEELKYTLQEFINLCNNTVADDYIDLENANDEEEENSTWHYVTLDKAAKIAEYEKSTLFKMPKGEFEGYTYYIPNGFITENEEKGTIRIGLPEEFVVKPKDNKTGDEISMTVEEYVDNVRNKKLAAYRYFQKPSDEAKAQFEKVEERLRRNIPAEMLERANWVAITTFEKENGKLGKRPIDCNTGKYASDNDATTWADFDTACKFARENGIVTLAYALDGEDNICCIDLDGCMQENGDFTELAHKTFNFGNGTYCERSISGKGLHIFGKTDDKLDLRSFSKDGDMEFYRKARFIAVTGDYYGSSELKSFDTPEMQKLLVSKFDKRPVITNANKGVEGFSSMSDRDVYDKACNSYNGERFRDLFAGKDLQNNHSNSDMSLMNLLAFWCNGDKDQMLRMFSASGLYRPNKSTEYYECTMLKALQGTTDRYNPKPKVENKRPSSGNGSGNGGKR